MHQRNLVRRRMQALDGASFRFERKEHTLLVNDLPAQVATRSDGKGGLIIELVTSSKMVQVNGATYWTMVYDDLVPSPMLAGMLLAKYDELVGRLQHISLDPQPLEEEHHS